MRWHNHPNLVIGRQSITMAPNDKSGHDASDHLERCRSIVENAPEILAMLDATGTILYANPHMEKVLGYWRDEMEGRNIFNIIHPEDAPRAAQEYSDTVQQKGERPPSVLRLRDTNGEWIPFEIVASNRLHDPKIQAVIFTARDLRFRKELEAAIRRANADTDAAVEKRTTELTRINAELRIENQARRRAEDRLQQSISLLNATLDSTADGILVVSTEGKVASCNQKFVDMWRLSCHASIGKDDHILLAEVSHQLKDPKNFLEKVQTLYADDSTSFDVLYFKDGRIFERYSQPQRINGKVTGRVWSFRDVTRARNLELELRQSQKMEVLGRLAGGIAHDFNNLLMLISGYAALILGNPSLKEGHAPSEQILATTRRAASVIKQLLTFSRKQPDAPTEADLNLIVLNLERMLRRLLSDQIQLEVSVSPDLQPIYVDVSQIEMMIMNLAVNAQDAMPDGGRLSISTASKVLRVNDGEHKKDKTFTVLEISDTGHGMTPEVQAHVFEPFFTTKQLGKGTGLGLSSAQNIVQRAGGRVEVQSEPGHGATFRIYLPHNEAVPAPVVASPASAPGGGDETILLAEDESGIRTMTRAYLESLGYSVLEAASGSEAVERAREYTGPIHLVLTDVLMPGMRGDSAVKEIQAHRPTIKAIFMSGFADQDIEDSVDGILHKPFEFPELGRRIRATLDSDPADASHLNQVA
jgi:two-component system, cell cycle sensor histidine kinase and response regulator CckA